MSNPTQLELSDDFNLLEQASISPLRRHVENQLAHFEKLLSRNEVQASLFVVGLPPQDAPIREFFCARLLDLQDETKPLAPVTEFQITALTEEVINHHLNGALLRKWGLEVGRLNVCLQQPALAGFTQDLGAPVIPCAIETINRLVAALGNREA